MGDIKKRNRINGLFIPFKYKINSKVDVFRVFKKIPEIHTLDGSQKDIYNVFLHKLNSNCLSEAEERKIYSATYSSLLTILRKEKKKLLKNKYTEDAIIAKSWKELYSSLKSPLYIFQDLYFQYIHSKFFVELFGEDIYEMIEEVLRDDFITNNEKRYLLEKAEEFGINKEKMSALLEEYFDFNPAIKKLLYEICKDGVITDAEKKYLVEKANQYQISSDRITVEIESIVNTISKIHELFRKEEVYDVVLLLFLMKFIDPLNRTLINRILDNINLLIVGKEETINLAKEEIIDHIISSFNSISKIKIFHKKNTTVSDIIYNLSLIKIQHSEILTKYSDNVHEKFSAEAMIEVFTEVSDKNQKFIQNNDHYKIGGEEYELNYVEETNAPLFCFDTIGNRTIISINRSHYFYQDIFQLKIGILSMVINLKKNYASEDLIEEVQHILNPPARIRINFPKGL